MKNGLMKIVDDNNNELPNGIKGELCLCGPQLTPGYIDNNDMNENKFFTNKQGLRLYKTGDICIKDKEGDYLFCGRNDLQVKIQGIRIELEEIEFHAHKYIRNGNVIALSYKNKTGITEIALFIEVEKIDENDLLNQMKLKMPKYMIPSKIICIPEFPLNSNSKTDRIALQKIIIE